MMVDWGSWYVEYEHPRGRGGRWVSKGATAQLARDYKRLDGRPMRVAQRAARAFQGGMTTKSLQVFRTISDEFSTKLEGMAPGTRIMRADVTPTTLQKPSDVAMRILLPKGTPAQFMETRDLEVQLKKNAALQYEGKDATGNHVFRAVTGVAKPKLGPPKEERGMLRGMAPGSHPGTISPSLIKKEDGRYRPISIATMKEGAKLFENAAARMSDTNAYPMMRPSELRGKDATGIIEAVKNRIKDNLLFMYRNATPEELLAKNWYRGARRLVDEQVSKYKLNDASVSAVFASLSPQTSWEQNIYLAQSLIEIYQTKQDHDWDKDMTKAYDDGMASKGNRDLKAVLPKIKGKRLSQLSSAREKAAWIRLFSEAHTDRNYRAFNFDGTLGDFMVNKDGTRSTAAWHQTAAIANAILALEANGDREKISKALTSRHKVRSFYNNILDPDSDNLDLTVDTHAAGAGNMRVNPKIAILHSLGLSPKGVHKPKGFKAVGKSAPAGAVGTYGVYADAYRETAKELGLRPNELQAIIWTVKRNAMFSSDYSDEDSKRIDGMWNDYRHGKKSLIETQRRIMGFARSLEQQRKDERRLRELREEMTAAHVMDIMFAPTKTRATLTAEQRANPFIIGGMKRRKIIRSGYSLEEDAQPDAPLAERDVAALGETWVVTGSHDVLEKQAVQALLDATAVHKREFDIGIERVGSEASPTGTRVFMVGGKSHSVRIDDNASFIEACNIDPDARFDNYHSHPSPFPLSLSDVLWLNQNPQVLSMRADAEDGSWSRATIPARDRRINERIMMRDSKHRIISRSMMDCAYSVYEKLFHKTDGPLRNVGHYNIMESGMGEYNEQQMIPRVLFAHAMNTALDAEGLIKYEYHPAERQTRWLTQYREQFNAAVTVARATIRERYTYRDGAPLFVARREDED